MQVSVQGLRDWATALSGQYQRTRASLAAGGLAYFVALSIAPAALAFGTLAGIFLDPAQVKAALDRLAERAPQSLGNLQPVVEGLMSTVERASASTFTITTIVSLVIAVYAASKVVFGLRLALNSAYGIEETRSGLLERAVSAIATLVALVGGVALVVLLTIVPRVLEWFGVTDTRLTSGSLVVDWAIAVVVVFLVVWVTLRRGPNVPQPVAWTSPGLWLATIGIMLATVGVGLYARFSTSLSAAVLVFGTAVVILLWLYLCFVALLWGAIVDADLTRRRTTSAAPPPGP